MYRWWTGGAVQIVCNVGVMGMNVIGLQIGNKLGQQQKQQLCRARVGSFKTRLISALPPVRTHERDTQEAPIETSLADFCKASRLRGFQLSKYALLY